MLTAARVAAAHFDGLSRDGLGGLPPDLAEVLLDALAASGRLTTRRLAALCGVRAPPGEGEEGAPPPAWAAQPLAGLHLASAPGTCDAWLSLVPPGRLAAVDVSGCGLAGVTDAGLAALAWAHAATLTSLVARAARGLTDEGVAAVAACAAGLVRLDLSGCDRLERAGVRAIGSRLQRLTALSLQGCAGAACPGGPGGGFGRALARLPALASLDAGWVRCLGDADAAALAASPRPHAPGGLTFLSLAHTAVGDAGAAALAAHCRGLVHLDLSGCARLGPRGVAALAAGGALPSLTALDLSSTAGRTDGAYAPLGALPALASLRLGFTEAGDATAAALAGGAARCRLTTLDLEATPLTDVGVALLASGLPRLVALSLSDCGRVGDGGAAALAGVSPPGSTGAGTGARCLETLDLSFTITSDTGLHALARGPGCRRLRALTLDGPAITDAGVAAFAATRAEDAVWQWVEEWVEAEEGEEGRPHRRLTAPVACATAPAAAPSCAAAAAAAANAAAAAVAPPPSPDFAGHSPTSVLPSAFPFGGVVVRSPSSAAASSEAASFSSSPPFSPFSKPSPSAAPFEDAAASPSPPSSPFPGPFHHRRLTRLIHRRRVRGAPADLRSLSIGGCCRLTEAGVAALASLGGLAELEVACGVSDAGAAALAAAAHATGLTRLALPRSPRLSNAGLGALAAGLGGPGSVLASLDLAGSGVTPAGLAALLPAFGASLAHAVLPAATTPAAGRGALLAGLRAGMPRLQWVKWH